MFHHWTPPLEVAFSPVGIEIDVEFMDDLVSNRKAVLELSMAWSTFTSVSLIRTLTRDDLELLLS